MSVKTDIVNLRVIVNGNAAKKELAALDQEYVKIKNSMKGLKKGTDEYVAANKRLQEITDRMAGIKKEIGLTALNLRELNAEARRLRAMKQHLTPGTEAFLQNEKALRAVNQRIQEVNSGLGPFAAAWKKVSIEAKAAVALLSAGFAYDQFRNLIQGAIDFDEAIADVTKVTQLSAAEMKQLNSELSKIDTRSSRAELLDLAYEAGKLGNDSVDDVLAFVRAADQIKVALGRDLGDDAITQIGKMVSIFKLKDTYGLEEGMLKIASVINDVGMASTATEGYLVDFAKRMSGVSGIAKITAPEIMGLAGTLDSLGQTSEVSSTAISKLLTKMGADVQTFARMAKMSEKDFRALMGESGLKALLKVIEEMGKTGGGLEALAGQLGDIGLDGGRVVGVLGTLGANIDEVRRQTDLANAAFEKGTSITQEFNIKNATMGAVVKKTAREIYGMLITEKVKDSLKAIVISVADFIKVLKENSTSILTFIKIALVAATAVLSYNAAVKMSIFLTNNSLKAIILETVAKRASAAASVAARAATLLFAAAKAVLTGNITRATIAMRAFSITTKSSPWGLIIGLVTAAATAYALFRNQVKEANQTKEEAVALENQWTKKQAEEIGNVKALFTILRKSNPESQTRAKLIDEINSKYGTTLKNLKDETEFMKQLATAQEQVINNLKRKFAIEAQEEGLKTNAANNIKYQLELVRIQDEIARKQAEASRLKPNESRRLAIESELQTLETTKKAYEEMLKISEAGFDKIFASTQKVIDQLGGDDIPLPDPAKIQAALDAKKKAKEEEMKLYDDIAKFILERQEHLATELFEGEEQIIYQTAKQYREKFETVKDAAQAERLEALMTAEIEENIRQFRAKKDQEFQEGKKQAAEKIHDALLTDQQRQEAAIIRHYDSLIELNRQYNITEVDLEAEKQKALDALRAKNAKKEEQELEEWQKNLRKRTQLIQDVMNVVEQTSASILETIANTENADFQRYKKTQDAKLKTLDDRLKAGLISEEYYAAEKQRIEDDLAERERKIKLEQWKRQRTADLISAGIKTALAVVTALASAPPPGNFILAAANAAAGGAQIAAIASQPEPEFGQGAIFEGPSHKSSKKGLPVINPDTGRPQAWFEGNEALIPKKAVDKNRNLVEALIDAGRKDGTLSPVNFRNVSRSLDMMALAKGGYYSSNGTSSTGKVKFSKGKSTEKDAAILAKLDKLIAVTAEEKTRPAIVSQRQMDKNTEERNRIRRLAGA